MRTVIMILILAVAALLVAFMTGYLDISQTRPAEVPQVSATGKGITATGGQTPAFEVETGSVAVGTRGANVTVPVPTIEVREPAANQVEPQPAPR